MLIETRAGIAGVILTFLLALAACEGPSPGETTTAILSSPTPTLETATPIGSPYSTPSATATPSAIPTATASDTPTPAYAECWPLDQQFQEISMWAKAIPEAYWDYDGEMMDCPNGPVFTTSGAIQAFRYPLQPGSLGVFTNYMIWRADTRTIYVVVMVDYHTGASGVSTYPDTWDESQPLIHPDCADMVAEQDVPPTGDPLLRLQIPVRGFGKVWCEQGLWEAIGYGVGPERGVNLTIQDTPGGVFISAPSVGDGFLRFAIDTEHGVGMQM